MNAAFHPNSLKYHARRKALAMARWKLIADLIASGIPQKTVAKTLGICQSRCHYLEQKWHSHRLAK